MEERALGAEGSVHVLMTSKKNPVSFKYFMIFLVGIYVLLIFANLIIEDFLDSRTLNLIIDPLLFLELTILSIFILEILLNYIAVGFEIYYSDNWLKVDTFIILASFALVLIDIYTDSSQYS